MDAVNAIKDNFLLLLHDGILLSELVYNYQMCAWNSLISKLLEERPYIIAQVPRNLNPGVDIIRVANIGNFRRSGGVLFFE